MLHPGFLLHGGRYRLLSRLREGATAQVWRGLDAQQGREVALKAIPLHAGGADAAEHEAEAVARVRHPGVVRVHGTFTEAGHGWVAMELARCSLADVVAVHGVLDGATLRAVGRTLADVLAATHAAGVVHRDLKPQNVLVLADGSLRLADFGIARVHARGHSRTAALIGTLPYLAPEQRRDPREVRPATDVYAWGILLAWLRTGVAPGEPYVPEAAEALRARLREAGEPDDALLDVILAATRYEASDRPADGDVLREIVVRAWGDVEAARVRVTEPFSESWAEGGGVPVDEFGAGGSRPPQRPPVWVWGVVVGVGAVVGAFLLPNSRTSSAPTDTTHDRVAPEPCTNEQPWRRWQVPRNRQQPLGLLEAGVALVDDLDQDGLPDLAYPHQAGEAARIFWGDAADGFADTPQDVAMGRLTIGANRTLGAGDLDGDGHIDLVGETSERSRVVVAWGTAPRGFGSVVSYPYAELMGALAVLDWDGDARDDIVLDSGTPGTGLMVMFGRPDRDLSGAVRIGSGGERLTADRAEGTLLRLVSIVPGGWSHVEYMVPGQPSRLRLQRPYPLRSLSSALGDIVAVAGFPDGERVVRVKPDGVDCTLELALRGTTTWWVNPAREVLAGAWSAPYATSTYQALWRGRTRAR